MFARFLITFYVSLSLLFGIQSLASESFVTGRIFTSSAGCVDQPPNTCECGGGCACIVPKSYCNPGYTDIPGGVSVRVTKIPFVDSEIVHTYTDPDPRDCGNGVTCFGGTTTCQVKKLQTSLDNYLTQWSPDLRQLPAASVTCKYDNPTCASCCASWACQPCTACPVETAPLPGG